MSDKMDDLFASVKKMVDSGNIPDNVKQMMNNLQGSSNSGSQNPMSNNGSNNMDINNILSQVSPEMLNNFSNMMSSNNQSSPNSTATNSNNFNIDMNTIMKMKSVMDNMNSKNDPRANLLYSLKPYLRDSKKNKLDQYVNMLNISKIADMMNKNKDDKEV
mgnify:FL=1